MQFGLLALLLALLIICSFTPGFFLIRRLRWTPLEKLCGSVGLSLILIYLANWGIYCFGPQDERPAYRLVAGVALLLGAVAARDIVRLVRSFRVGQALAGFAVLLLWTLVMLSMIRVYSGAGWTADWYEHFHRSLFFLKRFPTGTPIFPNYALPARPPMMNVLTAFFLGLTQDRFELFQVTFGFLNILLFLPCFLLLPAIGARRRVGLVPLVALLAASPVVMENATYTWTKSLTVFYVVLAVALYLAGWRKRDSVRTAAAFVALAAGLLVHYSAGPYVAFLAAHYLYRFYQERPRRWVELAAIALLCGMLLATWFGWSAKVYGVKKTLASNTSVTSSQEYEGSNLEKVALNLFDTVVPFWLRGQPESWPQGNPDGTMRDAAFAFYQLNLVFGMGVLGGVLVLWLLYSRLVRGKPLPERVFWRIMVPCCVVLGIVVVGERDLNGVPHLTLISMEVLGLTLLAGNFRRLPQFVKFLVIAGCCVDFYFGVFLQARIESMENTPTHVVFPNPRYAAGNFITAGAAPDALSMPAWQAWALKHRVGLTPKWLAELAHDNAGDPYFQRIWPSVAAEFQSGINEDAAHWGGWAARHGGVVAYLGDWVAGPSGRGVDAAAGIFVVLFLALMAAMARQAWEAPKARAPVKPVRRKAAVRRGRG